MLKQREGEVRGKIPISPLLIVGINTYYQQKWMINGGITDITSRAKPEPENMRERHRHRE